ncbi:MAG: acyl-CoA dehydrogenase, partial [Ilumatobacteraceae bacterium]|nr:acyl-CoA dehydrogenase [Ilumatobacteraceae bacterium]
MSDAIADDLPSFRRELNSWLDDNEGELRLGHVGHPTLDEDLAQFTHIKRALFDAGWGRHGWPVAVGGLGGSSMLRAVVGEEIATRDLAEPGMWSMIEVLAPTV